MRTAEELIKAERKLNPFDKTELGDHRDPAVRSETTLILLAVDPRLKEHLTSNSIRKIVFGLLDRRPEAVAVNYDSFKEYPWATEAMVHLCSHSLVAALDFLTVHPETSCATAMWDKILAILENPKRRTAQEKMLAEYPTFQELIRQERDKRKSH